jgi:serine/threonine protein phosphatase PrpC
MGAALKLTVGQCSERGRKAINQDFYGVAIPAEPLLSTKGVAVAVADGIGSSDVSQVAAELAVAGLLDDYYCTSEAWSVKKSAERVVTATNSWLQSKTRQSEYRFDPDRGYVCTLSALVIKSALAHVFHIGDSRIYRMNGGAFEQLTEDHRVRVAEGQSFLARALGFKPRIEIDYQVLRVEKGDAFLLATDGVYEHVDDAFMADAIRSGSNDLDRAARAIVEEAYRRGSGDNLTVQVVRVDELPARQPGEIRRQVSSLPLPPPR